MLKSDRFSCSQKIRLKRDPPVILAICVESKYNLTGNLMLEKRFLAKNLCRSEKETEYSRFLR